VSHQAEIDGVTWHPGDVAVDAEGNKWTAYACLSASGENTVFFKRQPWDVIGTYFPPRPLALWLRRKDFS
jgi:hypothetical protein